MSQDIGIVVEDFFDQIRRLSAQIQDFPPPAALQDVEGARTGAAAAFQQSLSDMGRDLGSLSKKIRDDLENVEALMRAAAADLAETDAAAADTARAVLVQLEGIPELPPTPTRGIGVDAGAAAGASAGAAPQGTLK